MIRNGDLTLNQILAVADHIDFRKLAEVLMEQEGFQSIACGHETISRLNAVCVKIGSLGEGAVDRMLAEEFEFILDNGKIAVREKERPPVDANGRFIFENFGITGFTNPDWSYGFDQSIEPGYEEIMERAKYVFQVKDIGLTAAQFREKAEAKRAEVIAGPYANLFKGKHTRPFAIVLPSVKIAKGGLGKVLAEIFVPAIERGYKHEQYGFPKRAFNNRRKGTLEGQVETFPGSRQERLIAAMAEGPVVLWVFMNCLQGGSFNADRGLIGKLHAEFMLGGTIANGTVVAVYPEIAAASSKNPLYYNAADMWWFSARSLIFYPNDSGLAFDGWGGLGDRLDYVSGSMVLLA